MAMDCHWPALELDYCQHKSPCNRREHCILTGFTIVYYTQPTRLKN